MAKAVKMWAVLGKEKHGKAEWMLTKRINGDDVTLLFDHRGAADLYASNCSAGNTTQSFRVIPVLVTPVEKKPKRRKAVKRA